MVKLSPVVVPDCLSQLLWQILCCRALLVMMVPLTCLTWQMLKAALVDLLQICLMLRTMGMMGLPNYKYCPDNAFIDSAPQAVEEPRSGPPAKRMKQTSIC